MKFSVYRVFPTYCPDCAANDIFVDQFEEARQGEVKCPKCGRYFTFESLESFDGEVKYFVEYV